jgi:hypothetical protein
MAHECIDPIALQIARVPLENRIVSPKDWSAYVGDAMPYPGHP